MKNTKILRALLLLFVVSFSFASFAQQKRVVRIETQMEVIDGKEMVVSSDTVRMFAGATAAIGTVGTEMDIAAFDPKNEILCIINQVDNAADILKLQDDGYQKVGTYQIDSIVGRHDVEFIFKPCNIFLQDGNIVILANNKIASKLIVLKQDATVLSEIDIPFRSTDITVDSGNKQFVVVGTNALGYITGFVGFADGLGNMAYDTHNSFRYDKPKSADAFIEKDPYGAILAMVSMSIVFGTLILLFLVFNNIGRMFRNRAANKSIDATGKSDDAVVAKSEGARSKVHTQTGEEMAAIAAAVHFYNLDNADDADAKMTITRISKRYSPWSSKIYGLNNLNRK